MKILHVIPDLSSGGAETILKQLVAQPKLGRHSHAVVCLKPLPGALAAEIARAGVPVRCLGLRARHPLSVLGLLGLRDEIKRFRPDIVHTWMYHANVLGGLIAKISSRAPVLWALHNDVSNRSWMKATTKAFVWIGAFLSHWIPVAIVSVSRRGILSHSVIGYSRKKLIVIPNSVDLVQYTPHSSARSVIRVELGLDLHTPLIGYVARYHPMKDHANFIFAAKLLHRHLPRVNFLLCGTNVTHENHALGFAIKQNGLQEVVHLLGHRNDIPRLLPALDVYTTSSLSEGFPLAVGEAMASGIPCVVTDAGDGAHLVGRTGLVVPLANPEALAHAWSELLSLPDVERQALGAAARQRIVDNFALERMLADYDRLYSQIVES